MKKYFAIGRSLVVHLSSISFRCYYVKRSRADWENYDRRPGRMRVCDECQRLSEKKP